MPETVANSRKKLDLTGQRFGKLTVLNQAENAGDKTRWLCQCDCGRQTVAKTQYLRNGRTTNCGCIPPLTYIDGTCVEMLRAKTVRKNNTSGVPGVDWLARKQRWRATLCFKGKRYYLGSYGRFEDAVQARKQAEKEFYETFLQEFDESSATGPSDEQAVG